MFSLRTRWFKRAAIALASSLLVIVGTIGLAIAYPAPLFVHAETVGRITVYSEQTVDSEALNRVIADAELRLSKSPLNRADAQYSIFIAESWWKRALLFAPTGGTVGGVVYFPFAASNVFLSGADFAQNRLIAPSGYIPQDNRTLSYFIAHEITHLQQGARVGALGYVMLPTWIKEGHADRVGLGSPSDAEELATALKGGPLGPEHWNRFGYYSDFRYVVDELIDREGWDMERLFQSRMSFDEAKKMAESHNSCRFQKAAALNVRSRLHYGSGWGGIMQWRAAAGQERKFSLAK